MSFTLFSAYVRSVWLIQAVNQLYGGSTVGGFFAQTSTVLLILVLLTAFSKSRQLFTLVTLVRLALRISSMPIIFEVELWAVLMDITIVAAGTDVARAAPAIRAQLITFYAGAAFWKLNTSFLDARTSCGTIFFAQLIAAYAPPLAQSAQVAFLLSKLAPGAALAVELAIPLLLATRRRAGLALALVFHLLVVLTPPPNNAGGFSVCAAQYLFFFAPDAVAAALSETRALSVTVLAALAAAIAIAGRLVGAHPFFFDTAPTAYFAQFILLSRAVVLMQPTVTVDTSAGGQNALRMRGPLAVAAVYAFGLPMLGVVDQMAPNMFSNQRFHAGSNHLLVPTGLLHGLLPSQLSRAAFSTIRVTSVTSERMAAQYPAEVTASISPAARALLAAAGHTARQWNPMLGRVIGLEAVAGPAADAPTAALYSVPALELRRLIGEAQARGESFELSYTRLSVAVPPALKANIEAWRQRGAGVDVVYRWDAKARTATCSLGRGLFPPSCAADEVALLPPPQWPVSLMLFQPLPVLLGENWDEVHCYGP
jgi:hypothetical protein